MQRQASLAPANLLSQLKDARKQARQEADQQLQRYTFGAPNAAETLQAYTEAMILFKKREIMVKKLEQILQEQGI